MYGRKNDIEDPWIHFTTVCIILRCGGQHCFARGRDVFCIAFDHIECFISYSAEKQDVPTDFTLGDLQRWDTLTFIAPGAIELDENLGARPETEGANEGIAGRIQQRHR